MLGLLVGRPEPEAFAAGQPARDSHGLPTLGSHPRRLPILISHLRRMPRLKCAHGQRAVGAFRCHTTGEQARIPARTNLDMAFLLAALSTIKREAPY